MRRAPLSKFIRYTGFFLIAEYQVMCIFKALQGTSEPQEYICLKQFLNFYEVQNLNWKQVRKFISSSLIMSSYLCECL